MAPDDFSFFFPGGADGVLLIHGLSGTPTEMRYLGKGLARAGYTVYGMQLPGHCGSEAELLRTGWQDWCAAAEAAHDHLRAKVDRVFAGGLSMGALLALRLAGARPGAIAGLLLAAPTLWYDGWSIPRWRLFDRLLPLVLRLPFGRGYRFFESFPFGIKDERLRARVIAQMRAGDSGGAGLPSLAGATLLELKALVRQVKRELAAIESPALILHALDDDVASIGNALYLARRLRAPVRTVLLDDCYHMITVDRQRETVVRLSAGFFAELSAAKAPRRGAAAA